VRTSGRASSALVKQAFIELEIPRVFFVKFLENTKGLMLQ